MRRLLAAVFVMSVCAVAHAQQPTIIKVGDRNVHIRSGGNANGPVVVFESGFWDTLESWNQVLPAVAKYARVFAYDRAGLGQSAPAAPERSYTAIATELHEILQHEKVPPPYLFVGHSYGGALARVFYKLYPSEISGIVFVDPMNEAFFSDDPEFKKNMALQDERIKKNAGPGVQAEWAYLQRDDFNHSVELRKYGAPDVPMALLISTMGRPPRWQQMMMTTYGAWILARTDSSMALTQNSGHNIQREQPQLVIDAIRGLLFPNPLPALQAAEKGGSAAVIALFQRDRARYPPDAIGPRVLNTIGYELLGQQKVDDAVVVFAANAAAFPSDSNVYDSLAEAYADKGDREAALTNYRKSLELDPANENAARQIEKLKK